MDFGISRAMMLDILAHALRIPSKRRSALLGRFQHLQRLKLIEGINPGRGKAAEYGASQVAKIAIAIEILELGLSPERTVDLINSNRKVIDRTVSLAARGRQSFFWFDASALSERPPRCGGSSEEDSKSHFEFPLVMGFDRRMSIINVGEIIDAISCCNRSDFDGRRFRSSLT